MGRERADRIGANAGVQPRASLSVAELRQLISVMQGSEVEEITIEQEADGFHLVLRKPSPLAAHGGHAGHEHAGHEYVEEAAAEPAGGDQQQAAIRAPLVGIFRVSMKAGGEPMVKVGDVVREGQIVGAIEALNVLNEVEASAPGRITRVLLEDGTPVEYGQPLLEIEALVQA